MVIGPSEIDVSQAYNFSNVSGTFTGVLASTAVPTAVNFSSTSGTWTGMLVQAQSGTVVDLGTTSTARSFPRIMGAQPFIVANYVGTTTSSSGLYCQANSASSFTLFGAVAGTAQWLAYRNL